MRDLRVFGSVARGEDQPNSDVDLLADLPSEMGLLGLGRVQAELEAILDARVDLVPAADLKPEVRLRVEDELVACDLPGPAAAGRHRGRGRSNPLPPAAG
jgi:Predicted nucleotidyltransferases